MGRFTIVVKGTDSKLYSYGPFDTKEEAENAIRTDFEAFGFSAELAQHIEYKRKD